MHRDEDFSQRDVQEFWKLLSLERYSMPELSDNDLGYLREKQRDLMQRCKYCTAQTWPNYCRECDEHFKDGHWPKCPDRSKHSDHRKY